MDLLILTSLTRGPRHGYAIARWIETTSNVLVIHEGVLYPALRRLQRQGLLKETRRQSDTGRAAKYNQLTALGRARLRAETQRWHEFADAVKRTLGATKVIHIVDDSTASPAFVAGAEQMLRMTRSFRRHGCA